MNTIASVTIPVLIGLLVGSGVAQAAPQPTPFGKAGGAILRELGDGCYLIDFEGLENFELIGTIPGPPFQTIFGISWRGALDQDVGGSGNFANEPSPNTAAMPLSGGDINIHGWNSVGSVLPQSVQFKYSAGSLEVATTVQAWMVGGVLLDEVPVVIGSASGGASCSGDPTGDLCAWETMTFAADGNLITNIYFSGWMIEFALDDMVICIDPAAATPCCLPSGDCAMLSPVACQFASGTEMPGSSCADTMCGALPIEPTTWGTLKNAYRD